MNYNLDSRLLTKFLTSILAGGPQFDPCQGHRLLWPLAKSISTEKYINMYYMEATLNKDKEEYKKKVHYISYY